MTSVWSSEPDDRTRFDQHPKNMGLCFQPPGTALLNDSLKFAVFFHRDVGRKMLAFRASKGLLLGAVLFLFYDALQTSKPLKEEKTHLVASRRGSQHTRRAMKSIWLFSCLMLFSPCCSRTSTRLPLECTTDRLSRMASNGYDILLLEAQDRLSSNDLEGTGRGGQVELWDLGQVLQVDYRECDGRSLCLIWQMWYQNVPNPNVTHKERPSGMPRMDSQSACPR